MFFSPPLRRSLSINYFQKIEISKIKLIFNNLLKIIFILISIKYLQDEVGKKFSKESQFILLLSS
jgi:hypothetical protein